MNILENWMLWNIIYETNKQNEYSEDLNAMKYYLRKNKQNEYIEELSALEHYKWNKQTEWISWRTECLETLYMKQINRMNTLKTWMLWNIIYGTNKQNWYIEELNAMKYYLRKNKQNEYLGELNAMKHYIWNK